MESLRASKRNCGGSIVSTRARACKVWLGGKFVVGPPARASARALKRSASVFSDHPHPPPGNVRRVKSAVSQSTSMVRSPLSSSQPLDLCNRVTWLCSDLAVSFACVAGRLIASRMMSGGRLPTPVRCDCRPEISFCRQPPSSAQRRLLRRA